MKKILLFLGAASISQSAAFRVAGAAGAESNGLLQWKSTTCFRPRVRTCRAQTSLEMTKRGVNYYEVLGVPQEAGKDEIKRAYRRIALKIHPDVNDAADARKQFVELVEAYETLYDDKRRADYDRKLRFSSFGQNFSSKKSGNSAASGSDNDGYQRREEWRRKNPTRADIDDSFAKILEDILRGVTSASVNKNGIFADFLDFLESQLDALGSEAELDDLLRSNSRADIELEAESAELMIKQIKVKLLKVGEECLKAEREVELAKKQKPQDIDAIDRQMDIVDKAAGLRARYDALKSYLRRAESRRRRLERKLDSFNAENRTSTQNQSTADLRRMRSEAQVEKELNVMKKKLGQANDGSK